MQGITISCSQRTWSADGHSATAGPHQNQRVLHAGQPLDRAGAAMVLLYGRGGTAQGVLSLEEELAHPGFAYLAPQAAGNSWYPLRFLAPIESNELHLSSALSTFSVVLESLGQAGILPQQTLLLGFSQSACLALEFAARQARRFGGVVGLSGGLIGPQDTPRDDPGSLRGTPVFWRCSDPDSHIPKERVVEFAEALQRLGADVTVRLYPNLGHTVNRDELDVVRSIMDKMVAR